jgi:hypothetical protein
MKKYNSPLVSFLSKEVDIKTSKYLLEKRVISKKLQTTGLVPSDYYKPISKLCILI